jgi:hypothetical protein
MLREQGKRAENCDKPSKTTQHDHYLESSPEALSSGTLSLVIGVFGKQSIILLQNNLSPESNKSIYIYQSST